MNEFIVVSIGFQMNEPKPSQFNDSRNESLKNRVSQSWLLAAIKIFSSKLGLQNATGVAGL